MIRQRVSIRDFKDEVVDDSIIKELLISASQAPSAGNQQPWEFYVIKNMDILLKLSTISPYASCVKNANQAIVLVNKKNNKHEKYVFCDMSACCENLLLEIENQGLGGVWLGVAPDEGRIKLVNEILSLSTNYDSFAIIPFGYKKNNKESTMRYSDSKVHYLR